MTRRPYMEVKDISFDSPEDNVHFDEFLLDAAENGSAGEALRFWESRSYFVVLGRTSKIEEDVDEGGVLRDGIPVLRRISAGGTVLQGPGCLNYSLVLLYEREEGLRSIRASYAYIFGHILAALGPAGVAAEWEPVSDLVSRDKKFSGNAQARRKRYFLHHGTILYDFDISRIGRYLKTPVSMPGYRKGRAHEGFLTNIPIEPGDFKKALAERFAEESVYAGVH